MPSLLNRLLTAPGVRYFATRWAPRSLRRRVHDATYQSGEWQQLDETVSQELIALVERTAGTGRVLDLGCGPGTLATSVDRNKVRSYVGVDISTEAITYAQKRADEHTRFEQHDIESWRSDETFDLIVITEALYYVNSMSRLSFLRRCVQRLAANGCILVTAVEPDRFTSMFAAITSHFEVLEDQTFSEGHRRAVLFR